MRCIFAASSTRNDYSRAAEIAVPFIAKDADVTILPFPMTKDPEQTIAAWEINAGTIHKTLLSGKDAAFLTLGDPMTYSTFGYILKHIQKLSPRVPVQTIPGITSYQAAAAQLNTPLVEGEESLVIFSGVKGGDRLRQLVCRPENVVFLKAYRNVEGILAALDDAGFSGNIKAVVNCGMKDQETIESAAALRNRPPEYWTLIIAKQGKN